VVAVLTGVTVQAGTALSPEWDRGFDEAFTDLVCSDDDLVRAEFDALIRSSWPPPVPPAPPAPSLPEPEQAGPAERGCTGPDDIDPESRRPP
jgi:hypothetical protein